MRYLECINLNPELAVAVISVCIALIATLFTGYQAYLSRKYNKISLMPHLTLWSHMATDKKSITIQLDLVNHGIGPAIIRELKLSIKDKLAGTNGEAKKIEQSIEHTLNESLTTYGREYNFPRNGSVVPAGERVTLLKFRVPDDMTFDTRPFRNFVNSVRVNVGYQSLYGDRKSYNGTSE